MQKKLNVESFNLDHTKVSAPYIRLASVIKGKHGDSVYKYDIRFKQPNVSHMEMPALHSLEHLMAEFIRNHSDAIVDLSPMGCQTGFYLSTINFNDLHQIENIFELTLLDILAATEVPGCNIYQCGWAANHNLDGAKKIAIEMLNKKSKWDYVFK